MNSKHEKNLSGSIQQDAQRNPLQAAGEGVASAGTQVATEATGSNTGTQKKNYRYTEAELRAIGRQIRREIELEIGRPLRPYPDDNETMWFWYSRNRGSRGRRGI